MSLFDDLNKVLSTPTPKWVEDIERSNAMLESMKHGDYIETVKAEDSVVGKAVKTAEENSEKQLLVLKRIADEATARAENAQKTRRKIEKRE